MNRIALLTVTILAAPLAADLPIRLVDAPADRTVYLKAAWAERDRDGKLIGDPTEIKAYLPREDVGYDATWRLAWETPDALRDTIQLVRHLPDAAVKVDAREVHCLNGERELVIKSIKRSR